MSVETGFYPLDFALTDKEDFIPNSALEPITDPNLIDLAAIPVGVVGAKGSLKVVTSAALDHASFTDGGAASATKDIGVDIPAGSIVVAWSYEITEDIAVNGAAGETGFTLLLGDGSDADRFDPVTDPTETIASQSDTIQYVVPIGGTGGSGDGVVFCATAVTTPTLTLTLTGGTPDAGNFVHASGAGKIVVNVIYLALTDVVS